MHRNVLIISTMEGAENCAHAVEEQVHASVEVASTRQAALLALRRQEFSIVVVEESLAESDAAWAAQIWELSGLAFPLQVNFAISGSARVAREIKAAFARRAGEQAIARQSVARDIENELKSSVTGLLLESELVLREPSVTAALRPRLRHLVEHASALKERLRGASEAAA